MNLAHEGHQGAVRTKSRLREKVWWPRMAKQAEHKVKKCYPCQLVSRSARPEPI
uniref:Integrase zinc-binding domain-containing protein n=1 Tax=Capitella teleta TaxID=283909 RepID=X2B2P8_CAPTE